ncbi:T-complex protein 11-like protein 1 [Oppia nitens]|uniref:T-complex protein 11-like protein 1 n=1 Tax=Oppia nitens TaxID=1686743 RepID=UPI0023D9F5BA|nr:T-complex protein 11-like protein 1 [Oppia nitens]
MDNNSDDKICETSGEETKVLKEKQTLEATNGCPMTQKIKIPRSRTESTSSDENRMLSTTHDINNISIDGKRQKSEIRDNRSTSPTTTPLAESVTVGAFGFGLSPSPPRFISFEEIMKAANGVENMVLAHEIAVDNNFKLEKVEPTDNSLERQVKEVAHKAFWDILESQLNESPTNYKQALNLLKDIKENLLSLLLPQHTRLKQEIEEILDLDLIEQQADNGIFDFQRYAQYILSVCSRLCAPIRDETIRELTQTNEVISLIRGIMDLLDVMKLDMANFHIQQLRPHIQLKSIEYERKKFKEFLEQQSKLTTVDGLEFTKSWIKRNYEAIDVSKESNAVMITNKILTNAYLELLVCDNAIQDSYPETLLLDAKRIQEIREQVLKITLVGSIFLVTNATTGPSVQSLQEFKNKLKKELCILLPDNCSVLSDTEFKDILITISLRLKQELKICAEEHGFAQLDTNKEQSLEKQTVDLSSSDNRLRKIVERRVLEFIERALMSPTAQPMQIPTGLSAVKEELTEITGKFIRIVSHNRAVFSQYYADIITELVPEVSACETKSIERDLTL